MNFYQPTVRKFSNPFNNITKRLFWKNLLKTDFSTISCNKLPPITNIFTGSACLLSRTLSLFLPLSLWSASALCPLAAHSSSSWRRCFSWNRPPAATCKRKPANKMCIDVSHWPCCDCTLFLLPFQHSTELIIGVFHYTRGSEFYWRWANIEQKGRSG